MSYYLSLNPFHSLFLFITTPATSVSLGFTYVFGGGGARAHIEEAALHCSSPSGATEKVIGYNHAGLYILNTNPGRAQFDHIGLYILTTNSGRAHVDHDVPIACHCS